MAKVLSALPATFLGRTDRDDARDDADGSRGTTVEQRARILEDLCLMAAEMTAQHADAQRVLDWQDPLAPETLALLARLRRQFRRHA